MGAPCYVCSYADQTPPYTRHEKGKCHRDRRQKASSKVKEAKFNRFSPSTHIARAKLGRNQALCVSDVPFADATRHTLCCAVCVYRY